MRRRTYFILIGVTLLLVLGAFALFPSQEPSYEGRTLSGWLEEYYPVVFSPKTLIIYSRPPPKGYDDLVFGWTSELIQQKKLARDAISNIGPKAVPYLLEWIDYEQPAWSTSICNKLRTSSYGKSSIGQHILKRLENPRMRANAASRAFHDIAPFAETATNKLAMLLNSHNWDTFDNAGIALGGIGEKGLAPLMAALSDTSRTNRDRIAFFMAIMGDKASPAIPLLSNMLDNPDPQIARGARYALDQIYPPQPHLRPSGQRKVRGN